MKLKLFDRDHSAVGYDFEVINPEVLINQPVECSAIEDFSFSEFYICKVRWIYPLILHSTWSRLYHNTSIQ